VVQKSFLKVAPQPLFFIHCGLNYHECCKFTRFFKEEFIFSNNFERNPFT
jgi:hypothetical protein